jgi:LytR cell envelope-related transcriptional attenuator
VTILGRGDLSPRRRPRRRGRKLLTLLVVVTLAAGGWFGWQALRGDDGANQATVRPCVQPTHPPAPASAAQVHVRVLNGTNRGGLAHEVALQLRARGFRLAGVGNNPRRIALTTVEHPTAGLAAGEAVAEQLPAAQLQAGDVKVVTLIVGRDYRRLASAQQAAQARAADTRRASPAPSPCPSASP